MKSDNNRGLIDLMSANQEPETPPLPSANYEGEVELAHFNLQETELLNKLQGGEHRIKQDGNVRSFLPLAPLFEDPQYRELVEQIVENLHLNNHEDEEIVPALDEYLSETKPKTTIKRQSPEVNQLSAEGEGGDTEIALCPKVMLDTFDEIRGFTMRNPEDGLRQYFLPILAAVLAKVALPAVVAAGASKLSGGSWKDAGKAALSSAIGQGVSHGIGHIMGSNNLQGSPGGFGNVLSNIFGGGQQSAPGAAAQQNMRSVLAAKGNQAEVMGGGNNQNPLSNLLTPDVLIPTTLMSGLLFKAQKDYRKRENRYQQEMNDYKQSRQKASQGIVDMMNMQPDVKLPARKTHANINTSDLGEGGYAHQYFAEGGQIEEGSSSGAIEGKGKGQEDAIYTDYHPFDQITDASTVSDLGDGSTKAGQQQLDALGDHIEKTSSYKKGSQVLPEKMKKVLDSKVPVAVSDGEHRMDRYKTLAAGEGDVKKAGRIFKTMTNLIRKDKRNSGDSLPKKAKSAIHYYEQAKDLEG